MAIHPTHRTSLAPAYDCPNPQPHSPHHWESRLTTGEPVTYYCQGH